MHYSLKSFNPELLPAFYGAVKALYPHTAVKVRRGSAEGADGEAAMELLRAKWDSLKGLEVLIETDAGFIRVKLHEFWDLLLVRIEGGTESERQKLHDLARGILGLSDPTEAEIESVSSLPLINQRILRVQQMIRDLPAALNPAATRLRCFVSFRFDEHSKSLALELRDFMELAGLEFVSGLGYQPRSVSAKVLERLQGKIDLFLVIFSTTDDSAWLQQEIGVAKGRNLPVMVVVEDGAKFTEGILSDTEYAPFPKGQISGAFIPLLQAIQYIRLQPNATS